jgi:hypothetical protein
MAAGMAAAALSVTWRDWDQDPSANNRNMGGCFAGSMPVSLATAILLFLVDGCRNGFIGDSRQQAVEIQRMVDTTMYVFSNTFYSALFVSAIAASWNGDISIRDAKLWSEGIFFYLFSRVIWSCTPITYTRAVAGYFCDFFKLERDQPSDDTPAVVVNGDDSIVNVWVAGPRPGSQQGDE